jgi:hypothetical protein
MRVCYYHEDRQAIGICMRCRVPICGACTTRLQGINHCHKCLQALASRKEDTGFDAGPLIAGAVLFVGVLVLFGVCWLLQGSLAP